MIHVRQAREQGDVVLEFSGPLDLRGAEDLVEIAAQQPVDMRVVIDISLASHVHDAAVGLLEEGLPGARPHIIRGLDRHEREVLQQLEETAEELAHTD